MTPGPAPGVIVSLEETVAGGDVIIAGTYVAAPAAAAVLHQLPPPPRDFTGRAAELRELVAAVREGGASVVGIRGMGGVGKTALALELARQLTPGYPDAQLYLDLRGSRERPMPPVDAMVHVVRSFLPTGAIPEDEAGLSGCYRSLLSGKRAILLLDNAADEDQVLPLLPGESCLVLVTSRRNVVVPGMLTRRLETLPPDEARSLLLKISPGMEEEADPIAALCGYLPLALRAAASLIAVSEDLDAAAYAGELVDEKTRLERLGTEGIEASVEAAFDLSYRRLEPETARVFRALAVFPGSFTAETEESVCADPGRLRLRDLVRRSLVQWDQTTRRYRLHDLLRVFASGRLPDDERAAARCRHARSMLELVETAEPELLGPQQAAWVHRLELEQQNLRAALDWALADGVAAPGGDEQVLRSALALRLAGGLWRFWVIRGYLREGEERLGAALARMPATALPAERAKAVTGAGILAYFRGDHARAASLCEEGLALCREAGDRWSVALSLLIIGMHRQYHPASGDQDPAKVLFQESLALARELGDAWLIALALGELGLLELHEGGPERALALCREGLALARENGNQWLVAVSLGNTAFCSLRGGDPAAAAALFRESLVVRSQLRDQVGITVCLGGLAGVAAFQGQGERAARLFGAADALVTSIGAALPPAFRIGYDRMLAGARTRFGEESFEPDWREGHGMSLADAVDHALEAAAGQIP